MSKIGKKPIQVPKGVEIKLTENLISAKGPKGELSQEIYPTVQVELKDDQLFVTPMGERNRDQKIVWGLTRSLIQNMIKGVTEGFERVLEFQGVGYKATVKGNDLELGLGFSHPILIKGAEGITFKTEKSSIRVQGIDKELVGKIAANIRSYRLPEPYKGSGIRYQEEIIRRKAGKKAVASG
ncbi:50S ribosomal protein L6 [Candidatus Parcubacteria bacterium]|nr:50S ribosomal protein L6 [Candidatus Parcubacteria bacterium]